MRHFISERFTAANAQYVNLHILVLSAVIVLWLLQHETAYQLEWLLLLAIWHLSVLAMIEDFLYRHDLR